MAEQGQRETSPPPPVEVQSPRFSLKKVVDLPSHSELLLSPLDYRKQIHPGTPQSSHGGIPAIADQLTAGVGGGEGCVDTSFSSNAIFQLPMRKQRSVNIDPSDAALLKREVVMTSGRWIEPPSPAPAKDVAKRIRDQLLLSEWKPPSEAGAGMGMGSLTYLCSDCELLDMCRLVRERRWWCQSSCVKLRTPCKIFGDVHGQFSDLRRFFSAYGSPNPYTGDVEYVNYLFLGDYVDRGKHSLEVVAFLVALKICHPTQVVLLRGNHEDPQVNALYGFRAECLRRCHEGNLIWGQINTIFEMLPVAAVLDNVRDWLSLDEASFVTTSCTTQC